MPLDLSRLPKPDEHGNYYLRCKDEDGRKIEAAILGIAKTEGAYMVGTPDGVLWDSKGKPRSFDGPLAALNALRAAMHVEKRIATKRGTT